MHLFGSSGHDRQLNSEHGGEAKAQIVMKTKIKNLLIIFSLSLVLL